ncbi:MAG TPA: TetR/AcrR family transcriptional regulator [Acidimicrobiales bacterium]|jgi:AcrR family transcriptional regulator|nr:TetR/AcrR family transcriptional regulator [Acidimicrobiales bacterium]
MSSRGPVANLGLGPTSYSAARVRTAVVALDLFGEHGVSGTSLQMIADALGVTKAAVYHQFHTKEAIVVAAVDLELAKLEPALEAAESKRGDPAALSTLLGQVIDLAIGRRRLVSPLLHDPVIVRLLGEHERYQQLMARLFAALLGDGDDPRSRVRVAMVASAIGGVVTHPLVAGIEHDPLRAEVLELSMRFLGLTPS